MYGLLPVTSTLYCRIRQAVHFKECIIGACSCALWESLGSSAVSKERVVGGSCMYFYIWETVFLYLGNCHHQCHGKTLWAETKTQDDLKMYFEKYDILLLSSHCRGKVPGGLAQNLSNLIQPQFTLEIHTSKHCSLAEYFSFLSLPHLPASR